LHIFIPALNKKLFDIKTVMRVLVKGNLSIVIVSREKGVAVIAFAKQEGFVA